jgi:hypothetical protein
VCENGTCTSCGALGEPCCLGNTCTAGACTEGLCADRICGQAPAPPAEPQCSAELGACVAACAGDESCILLDCYGLEEALMGVCADCIGAVAYGQCPEQNGCGQKANALRCCVEDVCPGVVNVAADCPDCTIVYYESIDCSINVVGCLSAPSCFPPPTPM